jgi:hypothetical protein
VIPSLTLPDEDDRHVLAAAICGRADAIITSNIGDFPHSYLQKFGIEAWDPDQFVVHLLCLDDAKVIDAIRTLRQRLKNPVVSAGDYLASLESIGLSVSASRLRQFISLI